ncbi:MAG: hypothetical protein ABIH92_02665 [Nanoarchaeota archaeon]
MRLFSISDYLGFTYDEMLAILEQEEIEVAAIREPTGLYKKLSMPQA